MRLEKLPEVILSEILSYLTQKELHCNVALVCKRFLQLSRSPKVFKSVFYYGRNDGSASFQSLMDTLCNNIHLEELILQDAPTSETFRKMAENYRGFPIKFRGWGPIIKVF
jgi:hypothetical protein